MSDAWSDAEIDLIVADYFAMLGAELNGQPFNKAERYRALQALIPRSRGSIEFKHQNISAVMLGLGQPWITGYKPAVNFQSALVDGVLRWLDAHPGWLWCLRSGCAADSHTRSPCYISVPRRPSAMSRHPLIPSLSRQWAANMTSQRAMRATARSEKQAKSSSCTAKNDHCSPPGGRTLPTGCAGRQFRMETAMASTLPAVSETVGRWLQPSAEIATSGAART
ncbi:MAG: hypothetical protein ACK4YM_04425 [Novosphingobium sp.]